ncbi:hypothetical protein D3C73_1233160 [compost metagenome]
MDLDGIGPVHTVAAYLNDIIAGIKPRPLSSTLSMLNDKRADLILGAQIDLKPMRQIAKCAPFAVIRHFTVYGIRRSFFFPARLIGCCSCAKGQILHCSGLLAHCNERLLRQCVLT